MLKAAIIYSFYPVMKGGKKRAHERPQGGNQMAIKHTSYCVKGCASPLTAALVVVQILVKAESGLSWVGREKKLKGDLGLKGLPVAAPRLDCPGIQSGRLEPDVGLQRQESQQFFVNSCHAIRKALPVDNAAAFQILRHSCRSTAGLGKMAERLFLQRSITGLHDASAAGI